MYNFSYVYVKQYVEIVPQLQSTKFSNEAVSEQPCSISALIVSFPGLLCERGKAGLVHRHLPTKKREENLVVINFNMCGGVRQTSHL